MFCLGALCSHPVLALSKVLQPTREPDIVAATHLLLQTSDFLVDEEAVVWFLDELLGRLRSSAGHGRTTEYNLRSRIVPPNTNASMSTPGEVHHSLVALFSLRKQKNAQVWHAVQLYVQVYRNRC